MWLNSQKELVKGQVEDLSELMVVCMSSYGHVCRQKMHKQKMKENIAERFFVTCWLTA